MRVEFRYPYSVMLWVAVVWLMFSVPCFAGEEHRSESKQDNSLRMFLRDYLAKGRSYDREPTRYAASFVDLRDDGSREIIVYVTGDAWCGSGGCTTLILAPEGPSYRVVTKIPVTRLPIRVLGTKSHGWHDISFMARVWYGEGNVYAREEKISFNGKSYRSSARQSVDKIVGEVVIPVTEEGSSLF